MRSTALAPALGFTPALVALALIVAPASAAAEVVITEPAAGATVEATFTVSLTYGQLEVCTPSCYMFTPSSVALAVDGVDQRSCNTTSECSGGAATFELTLEPGPHTLVARSFGDLTGESSVEVAIEVMAAESDDDDAGGCSCRSASESGGGLVGFLGLVGLAGLVALGRRRRS